MNYNSDYSDEANPEGSSSSQKRTSEDRSRNQKSQHQKENRPTSHAPPAIVTVGNGPISSHAAELAALIKAGKGKGKMSAEDDSFDNFWEMNASADEYEDTLDVSVGTAGQVIGAKSGLDQVVYKRNRRQLAESIGTVVEILGQLRRTNEEWPAQYFRQERDNGDRTPQIEGQALPRLVTAELAHDLQILKLDLKMMGLSQSEVVNSLQKESIAAILDGQVDKTVRHLHVLRERILDRTSKVLVTGDLNAGKSTFCNSLLRRNILPVDQQPCTSIFCEVLSAQTNGGVEEVHAIKFGQKYDRMDSRTFSVFPLSKIEDIVIDCDQWAMCKVYLLSDRKSGLLHDGKGATDIALIDAPGLNADSLQTTAVFARQEEIDVVVFVVSAANHFTQSAKEFISTAAREKAYMFMVVNGFDLIRDKDRCKNMILRQVKGLSPATYEESDELVHFVSSKAVAPDGDGNDPDPKNDGPNDIDFDNLEASLKQFVLEKKSRSKLAPAKTYLMNLLADVQKLGSLNKEVAGMELERAKSDIGVIEPELRSTKSTATRVMDEADQLVEEEAGDVYADTRDTLNLAADQLVESAAELVPYPGIFSITQFVDDVKFALVDEMSSAVRACEEAARERTVAGVQTITGLGLARLGSAFADLKFRSENMFGRRRDAIARTVLLEVEITDVLDLSLLWEQNEKKLAGVSVAVTVASIAGQQMFGFGGFGGPWSTALTVTRMVGLDNVKKLLLPGAVLAVGAVVVYFISSLPTALPRRLAAKLRAELNGTDHAHANATRISAEVRRALKYPAENLRTGLRKGVEQLEVKRTEVVRLRETAENAVKGFGGVEERAIEVGAVVGRMDLDGRRR